jgi:hypothetical protein
MARDWFSRLAGVGNPIWVARWCDGYRENLCRPSGTGSVFRLYSALSAVEVGEWIFISDVGRVGGQECPPYTRQVSALEFGGMDLHSRRG